MTGYRNDRGEWIDTTGQSTYDLMRAHPGMPVVDLGDVQDFPQVAMIVRELAERGPFYDDIRCAFCRAGENSIATLTEPANHELSCLWRRAKALYPMKVSD